MNREDAIFPFTAVVNQEQVKLALLLNAICDRIGGVLIKGRRGTAKSTLARGLAQLLPEIEVVADCPFSCDPSDIESLCEYCSGRMAVEGSLPVSRTRMKMVTLPLNATEEMVVGTIDIEKALRRGEKCFEPGILARANRSILYVDEVNLLEDHIVDVLLDSAAMGVNVVEREGISFRHGARFILIGTMNPEEGDLRPQLEDRFGLCAEVDEETSSEDRAEVLKRTLLFTNNPLEFESLWHRSQEAVMNLLAAARERYHDVSTTDETLRLIAGASAIARTDGHRADIAMMYASRALAAFEGDESVTPEHVSKVADLALRHRVRRGPLGSDEDRAPSIREILARAGGEAEGDTRTSTPTESAEGADGTATGRAEMPAEQPEPAAEVAEVAIPEGPSVSSSHGRRAETTAQDSRGRYYRSARPSGETRGSDIALDATIRASAARGGDDGRPDLMPEDLRVKMRKRKCGASVVFVVDASASMGARKRLEVSKQAIMSLLVEAYQKRDRVGLVVFKDESAQLVLSPTSSTSLAGRLLEGLSPGGMTPLAHGLALGLRVMNRELSRTPQPTPVLVLISDGGGNVTMGGGDPMGEALAVAREISARGIRSVVIDSAPSRSKGRAGGSWQSSARKIADTMGSDYFPLTNLTPDAILEKVAASVAGGAEDTRRLSGASRRD